MFCQTPGVPVPDLPVVRFYDTGKQKETLQNFERRAPSSRRLLQSPELGNRQGSGHIQAYLLSNPRSIDSPLIG